MLKNRERKPCPYTPLILAYYETGDENLLRPLFDRLPKDLDRYTQRILFSTREEYRADLVQDTLVHLLELLRNKTYQPPKVQPGQFVGTGLFWTWLCTVHKHRVMKVREKPLPSEPGEEEDPFPEWHTPIHHSTEDPEHLLRLSQARAAVAAITQAVLSLPPRQKTCFLLHYFRQLTNTQIAKQLGISYGTVSESVLTATTKLQAWAQNNPHLKLSEEVYEVLSSLDTGALFEDAPEGLRRPRKSSARILGGGNLNMRRPTSKPALH